MLIKSICYTCCTKIAEILTRTYCDFASGEARGNSKMFALKKIYSTTTGGYAIELSMTTLHKHQNRACVRVLRVCAPGKKYSEKIRQDNNNTVSFQKLESVSINYNSIYIVSVKKKDKAKLQACTRTYARVYPCVGTCLCACARMNTRQTCMYIGNTLVRLQLVARNSDANVIVTAKKRNMRQILERMVEEKKKDENRKVPAAQCMQCLLRLNLVVLRSNDYKIV